MTPRLRPGRKPAQIIDLAVVRRRRTVENWLIALMIASSTVFAGAMAVYVFQPATTTLVGHPTVAFNSQEP